jgi:hypothetical protein
MGGRINQVLIISHLRKLVGFFVSKLEDFPIENQVNLMQGHAPTHMLVVIILNLHESNKQTYFLDFYTLNFCVCSPSYHY